MNALLKLFMVAAVAAGSATSAAAQPSEPTPPAPADTTIASGLEQSAANPEQSPPTRQAAIEEEQAAKAAKPEPYTPSRAELIFRRVDTILAGGTLRWHPFFASDYNGGGLTLGVGHASYVSAYNYIDVRGSYSIL